MVMMGVLLTVEMIENVSNVVLDLALLVVDPGDGMVNVVGCVIVINHPVALK